MGRCSYTLRGKNHVLFAAIIYRSPCGDHMIYTDLYWFINIYQYGLNHQWPLILRQKGRAQSVELRGRERIDDLRKRFEIREDPWFEMWLLALNLDIIITCEHVFFDYRHWNELTQKNNYSWERVFLMFFYIILFTVFFAESSLLCQVSPGIGPLNPGYVQQIPFVASGSLCFCWETEIKTWKLFCIDLSDLLSRSKLQ